MIYSLLLTLKFILYTNLIKVEYNRISIIITSSLISALILSLIYRSKSKHKSRNSLIFYSVVSILMLGNATYFAHFNNLLSVKLIPQIPQLKTVGENLKILLDMKKLLLIIDLPIIILYRFFTRSKVRAKDSVHPLQRSHSHVIPTVVEGSPLLSIINFIRRPIVLGIVLVALFAFYNINGTINTIKAQELFTYHLVDIKNTITKDEKVEADGILTKADIEDLKSRASLKEGNLTGIGKGKNLIVLQVEAFQNFAVGLTYDGQEITPNINKLIEDKSSIYYNNYHQMIGRGNTSDAEFVSQNSLYPSMEEPTYTQYVNNTYYGLPWLLRDNGYNAWVFHGYKADYWNREEAYVNQGFQRFISEKDFTFDDIIGFGLKDEDFFDQSIHYLKELDQKDENPFYAFMITLSSHTPFLMPEEYQTLKIREEHKDTMLGNYLQAIHYTDKEIGRFIESLKREGLYDDTVIAIYGDHFAVLSTDENEQPIMSDLLGERYDFDSMMNIPLIIHVPGEDIHKINSKLGSQLDFYPTIANIMGYNNEKGLVFGRDLNNTEENYVFPQTYMLKGSVITDTSVLEISRDGIFEHSRAYDRETRKEIDINQFKALSKKAEEEINKGHYILKHDTLKELK